MPTSQRGPSGLADRANHLRRAIGALALLLVTKLIVWSIGLGSGTSGGILAPLLMMGAALGGIMAPILPGGDPSVWATLGMAGTMAGVTRSPLTALVFTFELTHSTDLLLPLLLVCTTAHLVSTLTLKRSILTEKVARKGFHVVREYAVDPLEALFVRDVMSTDVFTLNPPSHSHRPTPASPTTRPRAANTSTPPSTTTESSKAA